MSNCCPTPPPEESKTAGCCPSETPGKRRPDYLLWSCLFIAAAAYLLHAFNLLPVPATAHTFSHAVFELINTMWWSVALAVVFVGMLSRIPQEFIISILGRGGTFKGLIRATLAGVLLDLCSHGILMVGMKLYQKGASIGQVMAFLIASPWNSLSLTLILIALIGLPWTLVFIVLSALIAIITGWLFDRLADRGHLPANTAQPELPENFAFWQQLREQLSATKVSGNLLKSILWEGIKGSQMVVRWLLFGVLLASAIRAFVDVNQFQDFFGPTMLGLALTLVAATIIEVCSEGSTPIAADLLNRANAPGNSFAFLMTGVATDYTEVMVLRDTTKSWKIALFLPLLTLPQVIVVAMILNLAA